MKYSSAVAFRQALDQRLKNEAASTGLGMGRLRKRVAFELFLRRLLVVAPSGWVLKGALALDFRLAVATRSTKDIDLGRDDDEQTATRDVAAAQQLAMDDFFTFAAVRTNELEETDEFSAIRFHVTAQLAGRTFEQFLLDIGFSDTISWTPETIHTSELLSFADIGPLAIPAIPIPQHLAEKIHAYTRTYGESQQRSTRPKDLIDILLIESSTTVSAKELGKALQNTFAERARQSLPTSLPPPPVTWADPYRHLAETVQVESDLSSAFTRAAAFLDPVLAGFASGDWDASRRQWATSASSQPRAVRALMFDCYGTLVQWPERLEELLERIALRHSAVADPNELRESFRRHQHRLTTGPYQRYIMILAEALRSTLTEIGVTVTETDLGQFIDGLRSVPPYPDVAEALHALGRNRRLVIISNSDDDLIAATVRGLGATVGAVVTAEQARAYKPDHAIFSLAVERAEVPPLQIVHVGASGTLDMIPACDLGLRRVWVDRRNDGRVEGEPDHRIANLAQLGAVVTALEG